MANPLLGEADFDHDGETLTIRLDMAALLHFESLTGLGLFALDGKAMTKLGTLAGLLAAGLLYTGQRLSLVEAAEMLIASPDNRAGQAVVAALEAAMPRDDGEGGDEAPGPTKAAAPRKRGGTGTKS